MPATLALRPASPVAASHVFEVGPGHRFEVEHVRRTELDAHLKAAGADALVWCFRCERSFRLGAARVSGSGVGCGYADCSGGPLDFWSWDAYCAFVGAEGQTPSRRDGIRSRHDILAQDAP